MSRLAVEESVYNLIPPEIPPPLKQEMYRSRVCADTPSVQLKCRYAFRNPAGRFRQPHIWSKTWFAERARSSPLRACRP